jgi:hypothetical protein
MGINKPNINPWTYYDMVAEKFKMQAYKRLEERLAKGEDPHNILKLSDEFYLAKILDERMELSWTLYDRIMGCSKEDGFVY